jgi:hypothetical protein
LLLLKLLALITQLLLLMWKLMLLLWKLMVLWKLILLLVKLLALLSDAKKFSKVILLLNLLLLHLQFNAKHISENDNLLIVWRNAMSSVESEDVTDSASLGFGNLVKSVKNLR